MIEVSIIVPVYNGENYIERCLINLLNQNLNFFEIIIVNDGSNDLTGEICEKILAKNNKIKVINNNFNMGVSSARNKGIACAKGRYIGFVDYDDIINDFMYCDMMKNMIEKNVDLVMCSYTNEFNEFNEDIKFKWKNKRLSEEEIKKKYCQICYLE